VRSTIASSPSALESAARKRASLTSGRWKSHRASRSATARPMIRCGAAPSVLPRPQGADESAAPVTLHRP
jgi:hypothetical protein